MNGRIQWSCQQVWATNLLMTGRVAGMTIRGFRFWREIAMDIVLKSGSHDGEMRIVGVETRTLWLHRAGQRERYVDSGQVEDATGLAIFVFSPPRVYREVV